MKIDQNLIIALGFTVFNYIMVFFAIIADLISGVQKAVKNGVARSSYGFRRSVDKTARYFIVMMGLTVLDGLQISLFHYLVNYQQGSWPIFPFATLVGALCLALIEVKSIYEKAEDKVRIESAANLAGKLVIDYKDKEAALKAIMDYFGKPDTPPVSIQVEVKEDKIHNREVVNVN